MSQYLGNLISTLKRVELLIWATAFYSDDMYCIYENWCEFMVDGDFFCSSIMYSKSYSFLKRIFYHKKFQSFSASKGLKFERLSDIGYFLRSFYRRIFYKIRFSENLFFEHRVLLGEIKRGGGEFRNERVNPTFQVRFKNTKRQRWAILETN